MQGILGRIARFCPKSLEFVNQLVNFAERDEKEFKRQVTVYGDYYMKGYFNNKKKKPKAMDREMLQN